MKLKFKTISSVILSPRMEKALYKGVDFKEIIMKDTKIEKILILYILFIVMMTEIYYLRVIFYMQMDIIFLLLR